MAMSNKERVGRALDLLRDGLYPFIQRELKNRYRSGWLTQITPTLTANRSSKSTPEQMLQDDVSLQLKLIDRLWKDLFGTIFSKHHRAYINELIEVRNTWAHGTFTTEDTERALDTIARLLSEIAAPEADTVDKQRQELRRIRYDEQARREVRRATATPLEGAPSTGLKPWRDIVTPHSDVASGRYQQAEFCADLWQVFKDEGSDEYRIPNEFFRRTYLTEGLKQLLTNALIRLSGNGGDPVIELQTNFGGGKTHAMLALYHLCLGVAAKDLPGLEPVFAAAGIPEPPQTVNTVVLVGQKIPPGQPQRKSDGTLVHTLWGELAWQLGGRDAYEMIRQSDETATNPGDLLRELFNRYAPCLILIDEWVAYARQLHQDGTLPGGTFDTHITFAQAVSESARNADRTLLVVSIPMSEIEKGGDRGHEATERLKNSIGRVESPWRPASAEESFEIVRRRLFQSLDAEAYVARDAVVRAFYEMYQKQSQEFPSECKDASYKRRLEEAYPIHPELFDRLYSDWSSLDKFQRTRGVLRLMAKVIHTLWERDDKNLLIMPASITIDDAQVQSELTRYLDDNWVPIIEKDVDGSKSLPVSIDKDNPNLGRYSACRRVTRTIYLGSAPTLRAANKGLEDRRIKLGCVQPGESVATFGDALRRLTDQATYLYVDSSNRYWISIQPNVTRTAQDRATQLFDNKELLWEEIIQRLKQDKQRGEFAGVHMAPDSSADIPDDSSMGVRLVILSPQYPHIHRATTSPARSQVTEILTRKGTSPRYFKNLLVFLVPDQSRLLPLEQATAQFLAWDSIVNDEETLGLSAAQKTQATTKLDQAKKDVNALLNEVYQWLLIPHQPDPQGAIEWSETRLQGNDSLILKASRKLVHEEHLIVNYAANRLRLEALDRYLWRNTNHLDLKQLWEYLAQYLYLPRLRDQNVLLQAIEAGVNDLLWSENFAYATGWDETKQRYLGLKAGANNPSTVTIGSQNLIVKPEIAERQFEADAAVQHSKTALLAKTPLASDHSISLKGYHPEPTLPPPPSPPVKPNRFYGTVKVDPLRLNREVGQISEEVLQHLMGLVGAEVEITIDIHAAVSEGIPETVQRTVIENCRTLKFSTHEFERM
jgi:predicted AAA+ superfamily ATPase